MSAFKKQWYWFLLGALAIGTILVWQAVFAIEAHQGRLVFRVFDIGQGDSLFIEAPSGNQVLVDGGPSSALLAKIAKTMPFWDRSIDLIILTHPHADHVTGLISVLKRYRVGAVLESAVNYSTSEYMEWQKLLKEKRIPVTIAERGQVVRLGAGAELDVLAPFTSFTGKSPSNVHNAMVVMRLAYASSSALLMGDAEAPVEYQLLGSGDNLGADVLKVGHHGSKTSSNDFFLEAVQPRFAAISVGAKNRYGHPNQGVIDRLGALGVSVFRTDVDHDITFASEGGPFRTEQ